MQTNPAVEQSKI